MVARKYVMNDGGRAIGYVEYDNDSLITKYSATFLPTGDRSVNLPTLRDAEREVRELERDVCVIF